MKIKKIKLEIEKAFSLVEVLISVFLVSVGLLATISLLSVGLRETMDSRNQVIASLLSQEGVELVRAMRDKNWAENKDSFYNIYTSINTNIDYKVEGIASNSNQLKINSDGFYEYGNGTPTKFSRRITIDNNTTGGITVESFVFWSGSINLDVDAGNCNTTNKCAYAKDILTTWGQ